MKKIYIDAGSHNGNSIRKFIEENKQEYIIYAFEPNPKFAEDHRDIPCQFYNCAVWIENGIVGLYLAENDEGSTLVQTKVTSNVDYDNPIRVKAIDFDSWIKAKFAMDDFIILKMDIEGAEFEVLDRMIQGGSIDYIDELRLEHHANKVNNFTTTDFENLMYRLQEFDIKIKNWR